MKEPLSSSEAMGMGDQLAKELEDAHKSREVIEEQYNAVKRDLIELSAKRTDLIKKKHDIEVILGKAKENVRRISAEKSACRDKYFALSREGR